ncbi:hypothetical protein POF50_012130 [Streptomyces sp. SL13]|uniref:Uncharacterized protein n=1 Tax=Streptantibioticus silvisoli TaxID=2705255 RepID=A0AA90KG36_9ACTN|nr:hypothetical protein [Streptantibioticus silvisoli]MDI5963957.1 hypothetical protein [Streptantibioticus silvisoli]MDI5970080.1 hypothetical protein [Streptantibioticus silvisoli]
MNSSATTPVRTRHCEVLKERGMCCTFARLAVLDALSAAGVPYR